MCHLTEELNLKQILNVLSRLTSVRVYVTVELI